MTKTVRGGSQVALLVGLAAALAAGCSAGATGDGGPVGAEGEGYTTTHTCSAGEGWGCTDEGPKGKPLCYCDPAFAADVPPPDITDEAAGPPLVDYDDAETCGPSHQPIPPSLDAIHCTTGMIIGGELLWACPATATIPGEIVPGGWPECSEKVTNYCEQTIVYHQLSSTCIGTPKDGWVYVLDDYVPHGSSKGCTGPCDTGDGTVCH